MLREDGTAPCHKIGTKPNACALALYKQMSDNHVTLTGPWAGWRLAGRDLVAPDRQRISPERLRGLLWREESEARRDRARARKIAPKVIPARERFSGYA